MRLKRSSFLVFIIFFLFSNLIYSQAYNNPESVVYDQAHDRYLISNKGNGDIISVPRNDPTNLSIFKTGQVVSMRGITISGNTLWCACTDPDGNRQYLYGFNLDNGDIIKSILIAGGIFINDVAAGLDGTIYVSDDNSNRIFAVNSNTGTYSDLNFDGANGLLFDEANNRLLYTDDTPATGSQISAIDLATNTSSVLITNANFKYLDGLTVDHLGNYYVSAWSDNKIYRYDPDFTSSTLISTGFNNVPHNGAADIFYDQFNNILAVPNFEGNTVDFIPFNRLPTLSTNDENNTTSEYQLHQNFPNPFNPATTISYDINEESLVNITIYDLLGSEIVQLVNEVQKPGTKTAIWDGRNHRGELVNGGVYVYKLSIGDYSETKKMVFLK